MKTRPNLLLLTAISPWIAWSAWQPFDRPTWWMEVLPVFLGFIALLIAQAKGWRFSNLALSLIGFHMMVLLVGGHYTYALVPLGDWVSAFFGADRNHYDRLGHLTQGFVPAIVCREIFVRTARPPRLARLLRDLILPCLQRHLRTHRVAGRPSFCRSVRVISRHPRRRMGYPVGHIFGGNRSLVRVYLPVPRA